MRPFRVHLMILGAVVAAAASAAVAQQQPATAPGAAPATQEVRLGPYPADMLLDAASPDGCHFAYAVRGAHKYVVFVDGKPGPEVDDVGKGTLVFSPDSKHFVLDAHQDENWFQVFDSKPGSMYEGIGVATFSPDSQRVAIAARRGKKFIMLVSGRRGPSYDGIVDGSARFSADSRHFAYAVALGHKGAVLLDGVQGALYDAIVPNGPRFGPDGKLQYLAVKDGWLYRVTQSPQ